MRKLLIVPIFIVAGLQALSACSMMSKCKEKGHKYECMEWLKGAKVEVTILENGAIVKVSSDKPELIKRIQEWAHKCFPTAVRQVTPDTSNDTAKAEEQGDSTSGTRMRIVKDLVCGMEIDKSQALTADYEDKTYYFCAQHCKDSFLKEPAKYIK